MARLTNTRNSHVARWVVPAAARLLVEGSCKGAPTLALSRLAHIEMGQSPNGESLNSHGEGVPFVGGPAEMGLKYPRVTRWTSDPTKLTRTGDIIVCVRATIGEPRWADGVYCLGRGVAGIRPATADLDSRFLFRIVEGNEAYLRGLGTGTTFRAISKQDLAMVKVPIIPIDKQRAIAAFLDWLETTECERPRFEDAPPLPVELQPLRRTIERIEELATKIEEARGLRRTASAQSEVLPVAALRRVRNAALQSTNYERDRLGNVTQVTAGGTPARDNPSYWHGSIPWVKSGELLDGDIYDTEEHISEEGILNSSAKEFPAGTILVALYGQGQTRGRTARLMIPATTNQACCGVLPAATRLEPRYVQYWLRSLYLELREESHGGAQPNWNGQTIKSIVIAMPPLAEQRKTVEELDEVLAGVEAVKCLQTETAAELDALLPSILDKAFKGELV
jgi:type I restriction enzyme, S subunit